jgi:hypothetical protein
MVQLAFDYCNLLFTPTSIAVRFGVSSTDEPISGTWPT